MSVQLSRGFNTVPETLPERCLILRSAAALALGFLPFAIHTITRNIFKAFAYLGSAANERGYTNLRRVSGMLGVPAAAFMVGSAKMFAFTQLLVWKHYVRNPESDGPNTRLAWYGADHLPWNDLKNIAGAFFHKQPASGAWTLKQWKTVQL